MKTSDDTDKKYVNGNTYKSLIYGYIQCHDIGISTTMT